MINVAHHVYIKLLCDIRQDWNTQVEFDLMCSDDTKYRLLIKVKNTLEVPENVLVTNKVVCQDWVAEQAKEAKKRRIKNV